MVLVVEVKKNEKAFMVRETPPPPWQMPLKIPILLFEPFPYLHSLHRKIWISILPE